MWFFNCTYSATINITSFLNPELYKISCSDLAYLLFSYMAEDLSSPIFVNFSLHF